jgi:N-sulfoglucosamine sulfohydrolase
MFINHSRTSTVIMPRVRLLRTLLSVALLCLAASITPAAEGPQPNILWISAEDISPDLGCYGDPYAITPNLDRLAAQGVRYTRCFTHAGVCAPSRSGVITGRFPPSIATHHMRCQGVPADDVRCFTEALRAAGYYCTNNVKTDYQFEPPQTAWDEISGQADWRGRAKDQPFFAVINLGTTHESQIRDPGAGTQKMVAALPSEQRHDPAAAIVPPVYPDTPVIRRDLANYADNITAMDRQVGDILARLEADGLAEETIVWFWGDHGRGMPRYKRWLYDSGTHTPLIIRVPAGLAKHAAPQAPATIAAGTVDEQLVAFLDFAPTMLSLVGLIPPSGLHGQAFLGPHRAEQPREYVYGHRDRMDETYDLIRSVRDRRYRYIRNFLSDLPYAQDVWYMNQMPTMQDWRRLHAAGELTGPPAIHFQPTKPVEELYDTASDPYQIHNLASDPAHAATLSRLRTECERWMLEVGDVGLIPEPLLDEWQRPGAKKSQAATPLLTTTGTGADLQVHLAAAHPSESLAYRLLPANATLKKGEGWKVAAGPIAMTDPLLTLQAKSCRIGYEDSPLVNWSPGQPLPMSTPQTRAPHWSTVVRESGVLPRLLELKRTDGQTDPAAWKTWETHVADPHPAMRYWSLRGVWVASPRQAPSPDWNRRVEQLMKDDADPGVRVLAATMLAHWEGSPQAISYLAGQMQAHPQRSLRLQAITSLRDLKDAARPFQPQLQAVSQSDEYVGRIARGILEQWQRP